MLQAILTGESVSVDKQIKAVDDLRALYQDKTCILFSVGGLPSIDGRLLC